MKKLKINRKIAWVLAISNAIVIFFLSSITFPESVGTGTWYLSIFYHFFAFFFLALFLLLAIVGKEKSKIHYILLVVVIVILYGVSDEIHQLFVIGRNSSFGDIITDSIGALSASLLYLIFLRNQKI